MIIQICGDPGTGKTKLATALGLANMTGINAFRAVGLSKKVTDELKRELPITDEIKGIYTGQEFKRLTIPENHLVYADYTIKLIIDGIELERSHDIDGFRIGLYDPSWETVLLPPFAFVILDEAQFYYDSKRGNLPDFVTRFYEIHRHNNYNFIFVCQRPIAINKSLRGIAEKFIFIEERNTIRDGYGNGLMTTWKCVEFRSTYDAEAYSDSKTGSGKNTIYEFLGDIDKCYDPQSRFATHYAGRENATYTQDPSKIIARNPVEIRKYNESHPYEVPEIFKNPKSVKEDT